jgi:hypothetical protein
MQTKVKAQFNIPATATPIEKTLYNQLKDVSDDLTTALKGGISISDNTTSTTKQFIVNSGIEFDAGTPGSGRAMGAHVIHTDSNVVTSTKTRLGTQGNIYITVTMTPPTGNLTILIYGA